MLWDIFCKVIDNHGDAGVCWRLSVQLAGRGHRVRLWIDDASALTWMAPEGHPRVEVLPWAEQAQAPEPGDVVIEAFGCELEAPFQAAIAARARSRGRQPAWINLEYLTAESFAERNHGLASPVMSGPAAGLVKHFFYPGFTDRTGGLLREPDLLQRQAAFDGDGWLASKGIDKRGRRVSLFCYEPPSLRELLAQWAAAAGDTQLLVTPGRAAACVNAAVEDNDRTMPGWIRPSRLSISFLPYLTQPDYDHLLWACDLNFVRGEDSLVRALWAGKPLVWQIYPQEDGAHLPKLSAFLDWLEAPPSLRDFHAVWNGSAPGPLASTDPTVWADRLLRARDKLLAQEDLASRLLAFITAQSPAP
ncbi:elongation factor P maturation arginine rhamnosyltransferase EarP [Ramlibacter sp. WS9]|uniref:elongation factor P maturation arginine rhamnosyltransferase EarP n=1 Tax=Ramlibacter sp. WS9 TaxID=1882741 RepID=UPI001141B3D5|nr:elongation factor P maturation arginine rhamnosyltransferase EarP [Ramlibacter sp. WS9]ROZ66585.1 elongation factor P maturation arginine rhamnosyltransferase EarP [Ramlibacter sp. WS9]